MRSASWLPSGFEFLSGLPAIKRKRRQLLVLQAFIDESGERGQGQFLALGGFIGSAENWAVFSDRWDECLRGHPAIKSFKMKEAVSRTGQFFRWSIDARDEKVRALLDCFAGLGLRAIYACIDLGAFEEIYSPGIAKPWNQPYFKAFHSIIWAVLYDSLATGNAEQVEIVFDNNVIHGTRAKRYYPFIRNFILAPELLSVAPVEPLFKDDERFLPLQAADMLAWLARSQNSGTGRQELDWVLGVLPMHVTLSPHFQNFGRDRLLDIVARADEEAPEPERLRQMEEWWEDNA